MEKKENQKAERKTVRIFGERNYKKFQEKLKNTNWKELYETKDPTKALDNFYKYYNKAYKESFPLKQLSRKKQKDKIWITKGLKNSINKKSKMYKKSILHPTTENINKFKKYRNILTKCLRSAESNYYMEKVSNEKQNVKKLWEIFGPVINPGKIRKQTTIDKLEINQHQYTTHKDISDQMNKYFSNIGRLESNSITSATSHRKYLKQPTQNSMFLRAITEDELRKEIKKLNIHKATGPDNVSAQIIKRTESEVIQPLLHIINRTIEEGTYPEQLKIAKVVPIYKKKEKTNPGNYRPISLLSVINKLIEKILHKQIFSFLQKNNILNIDQYGYQPKKSTTTALMEITEYLKKQLERKLTTIGNYLDLSKAFDTVDHNILEDKLIHNGIRGHPLKLLKSYLKDRSQYTVQKNQRQTK